MFSVNVKCESTALPCKDTLKVFLVLRQAAVFAAADSKQTAQLCHLSATLSTDLSFHISFVKLFSNYLYCFTIY